MRKAGRYAATGSVVGGGVGAFALGIYYWFERVEGWEAIFVGLGFVFGGVSGILVGAILGAIWGWVLDRRQDVP